VKQVIVNDI